MGRGSFYCAFTGITENGVFYRNSFRKHTGEWVDVCRRREKFRYDGLCIGALGSNAQFQVPVYFCSPDQALDLVLRVLSQEPFRVPLLLADETCPQSETPSGSGAPLWCLEQGSLGSTPKTTVHLAFAAAEKRRCRDYQQIFRDAICEALLTYRPFAVVFGERGNPQEDDLPEQWGLTEFFDRLSLPLDLFDPRHFHGSGDAASFLPPEKRGLRSSEVKPSTVESKETEEGSRPHPPMLAPPKVHLLHFVLVSLSRLIGSPTEEAVREAIGRRFAKHVPLHRVAAVVVTGTGRGE